MILLFIIVLYNLINIIIFIYSIYLLFFLKKKYYERTRRNIVDL
jgi:Mn2+/Fe2+ NRAMP family transporter